MFCLLLGVTLLLRSGAVPANGGRTQTDRTVAKQAQADRTVAKQAQAEQAPAEPGGALAAWLSGPLLALAALMRPNMAPAALLAVAAWALCARWRGNGRAMGAVLRCVLGFVLALAPFLLHNAALAGRASPFGFQGGFTLYSGNHHGASGVGDALPGFDNTPYRVVVQAWRAAEAETGRELTLAEADAWWYGKTWRFFAGHPAEAVGLMGRKALLLVNNAGYDATANMAFCARFSPVPGALPLPVGLVLALGAAGLALCWRRGPESAALAVLLLGQAALVLLFQVTPRYRAVLLPLALVFAGVACAELPGLLRSAARGGRPKHALAALFFGALVLGLSFVPLRCIVHKADMTAQEHARLARFHLLRGRRPWPRGSTGPRWHLAASTPGRGGSLRPGLRPASGSPARTPCPALGPARTPGPLTSRPRSGRGFGLRPGRARRMRAGMSTAKHIEPCLVYADERGNIYDHPDLLMLCRRGSELTLPRPDELIPLPEDSEFFLLPGRGALGWTGHRTGGGAGRTGRGRVRQPGPHALGLGRIPGQARRAGAAALCLGAVGFYEGRFYVCARRVDQDRRQEFACVPRERIEAGARKLLAEFPKNRLVRHLTGCALTYGCPAAKNLALGRFEAPLPTSRTCNARCVGCISHQPEDSGFPSNQNRITFKPTEREIVEVMLRHQGKERRPIYSFGQGCEGEPLTEAALLGASIARFRKQGGRGTVNINTNASLPGTLPELRSAGLDSIRVSLNSVRKGPYEAYYRPNGYRFEDVLESIRAAKGLGMFVSLNLLYFPGVTDCENEWDALDAVVRETRLDLIQLRNLNLDPELAMRLLGGFDSGPCMGLANFMKRLRKSNPHLRFGYFNPYLEPEGGQ